MQNIGAQFKFNFRELRREKDMSQAQFAEFLGISRPTVGFYESGERSPDADTIKKICKKCAVSADWLLGLGGVKGDNVNEVLIGKLTGLSPEAVRGLYSQKKKIDAAETDVEQYALLSLAGFINLAIEYFPKNFHQAHRNMTEAIADCAFIRDDLQERLSDFLNNEGTADVLAFIRFNLGGDIISADLKKEMCIDAAVKMYRIIIEKYIEKRGSELKLRLDEIKNQERGQDNAVSTEENE
jgi:transcriptional regulator with XRE-family HTH domain